MQSVILQRFLIRNWSKLAYCQTLKFRFHLLLRVSSFLPRPITILNIPLRSSNSAYLSQSVRAPLTCRSFVFYPLNPFVKDSCFPPDADHFRCHVSIFTWFAFFSASQLKQAIRDFGNNEINKGLEVREFKVHGQERNIYRVCCETCYQYHFEIQIWLA